MKKIVLALLALFASFSLFACSKTESIDNKTLVIGATPVPHAEILEFIRPLLEAKGYDLKIVTFTDYVQPNLALADSELDANYFQHVPYLGNFNAENGTDLVSAGSVHFEPLGIYRGTSSSLDDIPDGATIAVPNDATNLARALLLLEANGIITLRTGAGLDATVLDIASNPHNVSIVEIEAAGIPARLEDVNYAVINGNYALSSHVTDKLLVSEAADSEAAQLYANVIAVRNGDENKPAIVALMEVLHSDAVRTYIEEHYSGSVLPTF